MDAVGDQVDRLTRRRARIATAMGILFISMQGLRIADDQMTEEMLRRPVDYVQFFASTFWLFMLLVFILFGGGLWRSKSVRSMLNDEGTEENRRRSMVAGFWAMMAGAALCYAITFYEPVRAREAIHVIVTIGVGATLLRFGALERRALRA
jgi:ABC-type amino acid transport system permease subunit